MLDADNNGFNGQQKLQARVKEYLGPDFVLSQVTEEIFNVREINRDNQVEVGEIVGGVPSPPPRFFCGFLMLETV